MKFTGSSTPNINSIKEKSKKNRENKQEMENPPLHSVIHISDKFKTTNECNLDKLIRFGLC